MKKEESEGCLERIQELHPRIFEICHVPGHHRQSVTTGGGGELAVSGGESDAAFVATGYKLAPDVSGAGVETEDAARHAITEICEPCLEACLAFTHGKALDSSADFAYGDGADVEFRLVVTQPLHNGVVGLGLHQFSPVR